MPSAWCNYSVSSTRVTSSVGANQLILPGNPRRIFLGFAGVGLPISVVVALRQVNSGFPLNNDPIITPGWNLAGISGNFMRSVHYNVYGSAVTEEIRWSPFIVSTLDVIEISADRYESSQFPEEYNCNNTTWRAWQLDAVGSDTPSQLLYSNPRRVSLQIFPSATRTWIAFGGPKDDNNPYFWIAPNTPHWLTHFDMGPMIQESVWVGHSIVADQRMWALEVYGI